MLSCLIVLLVVWSNVVATYPLQQHLGFGPVIPQNLKLIVNIKPIVDGADDEQEPLSRGANAAFHHEPKGPKQDQDSPARDPKLVDSKKPIPLPPLEEWPNLPDKELRELVHTLFLRSKLKPEDLKKP